MNLETPPEINTPEEPPLCRKVSGWLWLLPLVSALLFWLGVELTEECLPCSDGEPEIIAVALGALFGLFVLNTVHALCKKSRGHR